MVNARTMASEPVVPLRRVGAPESNATAPTYLAHTPNAMQQDIISQEDFIRYNHMLSAYLVQQRHTQEQQHAMLQPGRASAVPPGLQAASPYHSPAQRYPYTTTLPQDQMPVPTRRSEPHHRVYNLRCAHCDTFFSDRGMRAVLLLKPHITLFSTDATPVNCGAMYADDSSEDPTAGEKVERTCDCLTQSLGCHCCGNVIGYQIITPCARCTASVSKQSRPANGHRFVFHHNEVSFSERKYHPADKGVRTDLVRHISHSVRHAEQSERNIVPMDVDGKDAASRTAHHPGLPVRRSSPVLHRSRSPYGLEEDDTVYWHYLVSSGELVKPVDPRTRVPQRFQVGR